MMDEGPSARAFGGRGLLVVRLRRRRRVWRMGRVGWRGRGGGCGRRRWSVSLGSGGGGEVLERTFWVVVVGRDLCCVLAGKWWC